MIYPKATRDTLCPVSFKRLCCMEVGEGGEKAQANYFDA